jgi:hypothetical protein
LLTPGSLAGTRRTSGFVSAACHHPISFPGGRSGALPEWAWPRPYPDAVGGPLEQWRDQTCVVCPAQQLGPGRFDVVDSPGREYAYDPTIGWRVDASGTPVCVHPFRVGLPPGRYASAGEPLPESTAPPPPPEALQLPEDLVDLEGWLVATLRAAPADRMPHAVAHAERVAAQRFPSAAVVAALRRALSAELKRK